MPDPMERAEPPEELREPTDPGLRQQNQHIGQKGENVLPDVVAIVHPAHAGRFGTWANEQWVQLHYLCRGVVGSWCEWFIFLSSVASAYPKISVALLAFAAVTAEEHWSDQPIVTNTIRYAMESYDPTDAERIFAERPVEPDPIGKAAALATEEATKRFMDSAEYRLLKEDIEADVSRQVRRSAYASAGMKEEVAELDAEIAAAREDRRAKRAAGKQPEPSIEPVSTSKQQGEPLGAASPEPEPEAAPESETPPEPAQAPEDGPKRGKAEGKAGKAERRMEKAVEGLLPN